MVTLARLRALLTAGLAGLAGSCHPVDVPRPPSGPHRFALEDASIVDYPPPPAQIEEIDPQPHRDDGCVYVDGAWLWNGRRWAWRAGTWVIPPAGCYYAHPESFWQATAEGPGDLYYRNPKWYPADRNPKAERPCSPKPCPGVAPADDGAS